MKKGYSAIKLETPSQRTPRHAHTIFSFLHRRPSDLFKLLIKWMITDWRTRKYLFFAVLLLLLTLIPTLSYYLNYPRPELNPDTPAYLSVVEHIQARPYLLVDTWRLPGYPLEIVLTYALLGKHNLMAVSIVQAVLFVLATMEIYILSILLFRRAWLAFLIGLLIGTNLVLLSYVKQIMSEGLALWLVTTVVLVVIYFIRTMRVRTFWLIVICLLPLIFTRPEWIYLPVPLFGYLLLVAQRRGRGRHLFRHMLLALTFMYAIVGGYIVLNTIVNHYPGLTAIENFNLMGKVLQYNMQNEVSPELVPISQQLDSCVRHIDRDPYHVLPCIPSLSRDNALPAGNFSRTIIIHHPVEFLLKSVPILFTSLTSYYDSSRASISGPLDKPLGVLKSIHRTLYSLNACFPLCVIVWFFLFCWQKTRSQLLVLEMGAIVFVALYALIITTVGGYRFDDYMRVHIVFDPLLIVIIWGSFLFAILHVIRVSKPFPHF